MEEQQQNQQVQLQPEKAKKKFWKIMLIIYLVLIVLLAILAFPAFHYYWDIYNIVLVLGLVFIVLLVTLVAVIFRRSHKKMHRLYYAVVCIIIFFGFSYYLSSDLFREWVPTESTCSVDADCVPIYFPDETCVSPDEYQKINDKLEAEGRLILGQSPGNICQCNQQINKCEYSIGCTNFMPCF
ncbi:MAG: transmembrane domain-containing protein [bacterium]|nr:transmembrane domain-containing protein [bacterium]